MSQQVADRWTVDGFIGTSKGLTQVIRDIKKIQTSDTISVVITGESGVGKELIARAIHVGSPRASGPFVAINCATIPKDLAESLFFGHIKGAFSGAIKDQLGYFEMAQGAKGGHTSAGKTFHGAVRQGNGQDGPAGIQQCYPETYGT